MRFEAVEWAWCRWTLHWPWTRAARIRSGARLTDT